MSKPRQPAGPDPEQPEQPAHVEPPRFLARTGRHGTYKKLPPTTPTDLGRWAYVEDTNETADDIGYTSSSVRALPREPECVGPAILEDYAQVADLQHSQQHALDVAAMQTIRPTLPPEKRLENILRRAKHSHVNLSREVMIMGAEIKRARTGGRKVPDRITRRMENVEALLDGLT